MDVFSAAPHHDIFLLVLQVAILLFVARALGEIATRLGQPSVIGEILAGILLGPSLLSGLFPVVNELVIPQTEVQGYLLEVISLLGAMFLLLITGLETDIQLIKRHAKTAIGVSFGGITVTFITGFFLGQNLPDFLLADSNERLVFSLFVATAMAISAIPVIAKVLMDMNLMRRDIGQTILAAGMSDDTIGWIMLSTVAGIAAGDAVTTGTVLTTVGSVLAFLILSFTIGRWMVRKLLTYVQDEIISSDRLLSLVIILAFLWGAITQLLNLEAILGAFVMGIIFGMMPRLPEDVIHKLESLALGIFAPVFFAVAGLKVNIINLFDTTLILITLVVIGIATIGKVVGTYFGARVIGGKDHWTSLSFGAGLNARGAMEIIIATIGLRLGILSQDMFSIIVVMAIATSLMAPVALRYVLKRVEIGEEEKERLKKEELESESMVADIHRVLLPVRSRKMDADMQNEIQTTEAKLLELIGKETDLSLTLISVVEEGNKSQCEKYLNQLASGFNIKEVLKKVVVSDKPGDVILDESKKDYDLIILGATEQSDDSNHLFSPIVDFITRFAPCPTMIVKAGSIPESWSPQRILVPTNGSKASKNAAELAFFIARPDRSKEVLALNVIMNDASPNHYLKKQQVQNKNLFAHEMVNELKELGTAFGVSTEAMVRWGDAPEEVIREVAESNMMDLIIIGTNIRPGSSRLYLGPRVENIIQMSDCPVIVFNT
ncbi:cation:proton antiporter [Rhodohalobacter mucosus]|uniref:Sodium:proton antiporter n=1 Tax=Rhodohalobacter mucosus TaxID=2079485 RepID=A0A316TTB6_9BACT|nr:cation:proton antiporter [Rhodohalobacter mucosus]PWN06215.1 sodium:proton antiporter [Rhodohalobacter mucosus]